MSGTEETGVRRGEAIEDEAAEWLWRHQSPDWLESDKAAFDAWLAQSRHHLAAYWRLKAAWSRTERLAALKPAAMRAEKSEPGKRVWPILRFTMAAGAAAALLLVGIYSWSTREEAYTSGLGQRATVLLADGSQVQLNTDTAITVRMNLWRRTVTLKHGEAFFMVHHDAERLFSVLAAGRRITDLGTEFAVRTSGDRLEVMLVQGRARLETDSPAVQRHATDLTPGEIAVATANTISVAKVPTRALANALAWRQGKLVFSHVTLGEAADEFNRYNRTKIVIGPELTALRISGTFDAGSIGPFTSMAEFAYGLHVERYEREIVLTRNGP